MPRKRRPNTNRKGVRLERVAIKVLESKPYAVHRTIRHVVRKKGRVLSISSDIYGCIDLIAKRKGERTRWIQVTTATSIRKRIADFAKVPWSPEHDVVELWRWIPAGKHLDGRTGKPRLRKYFKVYSSDDGFKHNPARNIYPGQ